MAIRTFWGSFEYIKFFVDFMINRLDVRYNDLVIILLANDKKSNLVYLYKKRHLNWRL